MEREREGGEMEREWGGGEWGGGEMEREREVGDERGRVFHFFWGLNLVSHSVNS